MAELPEGTVFAGHRIDGVAGRGGMGVVYRATHLALDHVVALKVIAPELAGDERFRDRFVRESRTAVSVRHPNVVQVRHAGEEDGVLFVTMDYVEGSDLRSVISANRRLDPGRVAAIVRQLAAALDAAHERGLVHRDVKPANVLIEDRAGQEHVYLTDFGLTKRMTGATELTASGAFIGTLEYMAPEQIRGAEMDARTDVYALAGVAFAALTGSAPFGHVNEDVAKLYAHLNDPPPSASERAQGVPASVDPVLQRAMAKDPDDRFASAGEFAVALAEATPSGEFLPAGASKSTLGAGAVAPTRDAIPPAEALGAETVPADPPTAATEVGTAPRGRRRALGAIAGLGIVGAVVAIVALAGGGGGDGGDDGDGGGGSGGRQQTGAPELVGQGRPAGELPARVSVAGDQVFVADRDGGAVREFATSGGDATQTADFGGEIEGVVEEAGSVWAADATGNTVHRLDPANLGETAVIEVGAAPGEMAAGPGGVWVANRDGNSVTAIDPRTGSPQTVTGGMAYPRALGFGPDALWVANRDGGPDGTGSLTRVDPRSLTAGDTYPAAGGPHGVIEHAGTVWVTATETDELLRFDADSGEQGEPVGGMCREPQGIVFGFERIWVTCSDGTVQPVDPGSGDRLDPVELPGAPNIEGIAVGAGRVWVAGGTSGRLYEIDPGGG